MRRREFIAALGGLAGTGASPITVRAQTAEVPVIGFLQNGTPEQNAPVIAAFRRGLSQMGFVEGRNVAIEYRFAQNNFERLPDLAADLVRRRVAVIATQGGSSALAAKAATPTIPIVFTTATDPVESGLVSSFDRPGGNVTGVSDMGVEIEAKRISLLRALRPKAERFALLVNPKGLNAEPLIRVAQAAASAIGMRIEIVDATTDREIDAAFDEIVQRRTEVLLVGPFTLFGDRRAQILTLAARHALPTVYFSREFAVAGGLMSYAPNFEDEYRLAGIYTGRILKGEKPYDLPVMRSTKFELIINLQTARALRIDIPPTLLALADEVIE
jgi:putative ABC transport system substrate-binding protein